MSQLLLAVEAEQFAQYEAVIERGIATFYEVGTALLHIRDERLYRETHDTFETYCQSRWNMGRRYTNQVIAAATVMANLGATAPKSEPPACESECVELEGVQYHRGDCANLPSGDETAPPIALPVSERQIRPLASLSPEDQRTVWAQAVEESDGKQPTALKVSELKKLVSDRIVERRREAGIVEPIPIRQADDLPPISRQELRELRERGERNTKRNSHLFDVIRSIETLSAPPIELSEVAAYILEEAHMNWSAQADDALRNLQTIIQELHK